MKEKVCLPEMGRIRSELANNNGGCPSFAISRSLKVNRHVNLTDEVDQIGSLGLIRNHRGLRLLCFRNGVCRLVDTFGSLAVGDGGIGLTNEGGGM